MSIAEHPHRCSELDLLRTLAIVMMIIYHTAYDLAMFHGWQIDVEAGAWWLLVLVTVSLFLLLVGISFAISWDRTLRRHPILENAPWSIRLLALHPKYARRAIGLFCCALLVSLATYVFDPQTYVRFGILHMIAVSILLLPFFADVREWTIVIGILVIAVGLLLNGTIAPTFLLLPFNVMPPNFSTVDYVPLLPWFGVVLIGYGMGYFVYVRHRSWPDGFQWMHSANGQTHAASLRTQWINAAAWPGRHALIIYLVHQPMLLLLLLILLRKSPT